MVPEPKPKEAEDVVVTDGVADTLRDGPPLDVDGVPRVRSSPDPEARMRTPGTRKRREVIEG